MKTSYFMLLCLFALVVSKSLRFTKGVTSSGNINGLQKAQFWVDSITSAFNNCKKFLSFANSKTVAGYWRTYGFSNLDMKGTIEVTNGVDEEYWSEYKEKVKNFYKVPEIYKKHFDNLIVLDELQDETVWQKADLFYDAKKPEQEKYLRSYTFMFTHTDLGDVDAVNMVLDVKFDLAPDTIVWRKSQTKFGAAWSKTEDSIEKRPRNLEDSDIEIIVTIAELLSFRFVARQLGLIFDYSDVEAILDQINKK